MIEIQLLMFTDEFFALLRYSLWNKETDIVISEKNMTEQQLQEKQYNEQIGRLGFYLKSKLITTQQYFDAVQALNQANAKAQMDDELKLFEEQ